jgi:diacylglycerol kinase (ATP)
MKMKNVNIIYNPNATGMTDEVLKCMESTFKNQGLNVSSLESKYPGNTIELVKKANEEADLIMTMGGDGTLGEAFLALGEEKQKALYSHMGTGTANDTASNFGLFKGKPYSSMKLYDNVNKCLVTDVDMLTANDIPFGYVSCCGTFTNLTYETPKSFKKRFGKKGYYLFSGIMGLTTIPDIKHKPLMISYDINGNEIVTSALTLLVSNTKTFAGFKLFPKASITDGLFEVTVLKKIPVKRLANFSSELLKKDSLNFDIHNYPEYIDTFQTDNFKVTFDSGQPKAGFNHDGDQSFVPLDDDNTLEYKVSKKVKMLLPKRAK